MRKNATKFLKHTAMLGTAVVMCFGAALVSSCEDKDENTGEETKETPSLNVSPTTLPVLAAGGAATFTVTANVAWTAASSDEAIVTVSPPSGTSTAVVTATVTANSATVTRTATITVSGEGVASKTVTVTQAAGEAQFVPPFTLAPTTVTALPTSAVHTITVTAEDNVTWVATSPDASGYFPYVWDVLPDYSNAPGPGSYTGTGSGTFSVYTAGNSSLVARSGTITVSSGTYSLPVTFTQQPQPRMEISQTSLDDAPAAGTSFQFKVISSIPWTATASGNVTVNPTSSNGGAEEFFTATIAANSTDGERTGSITVAGGDFSFTIPVTQRGTDPADMDYITIGNLKWAKYNQGYAGVIPSKVILGGAFAVDATPNACPTGWRLPSKDEWKAAAGTAPESGLYHTKGSLRQEVTGVTGFYLNTNDGLATPTDTEGDLNTHLFVPFINWVEGVSTGTKVRTAYATSDAEDLVVDPYDAGLSPRYIWFGGDGSNSTGNSLGQRVRCVQDVE
jgi:hypothetical protein